MYKKLAKITHPDMSNVNDDEEFKRIQKAYEAGDGAALLTLALDNGVEVTLPEEVVQDIEGQLLKRQKLLWEKKKTAAWIWCASDKSHETRQKMYQILGLDLEKFNRWKTSSKED
jgi:hypothetical protein